MEDKHKAWRDDTACDTEKRLLRKAEEILEDDYLSSQDLDDLKDIWDILCHIKQLRM